MLQVKIHVAIDDPKYDACNRYKGTYLHGELADIYKYDIFSFDKPFIFYQGMHKLLVDDKHCTFFLWYGKIHDDDVWRGYLVLDSDTECYEQARRSYKSEQQII
jgi:hypothetical protein